MNVRIFRVFFAVIVILWLGYGVSNVASADSEPNPGRCPLQSGRPTLQSPAVSSATISCGYGCYYHVDSFYKEYYALDFRINPGSSFEVTAAAGGTLIQYNEPGVPREVVNSVTGEIELIPEMATVLWVDHENGWYTKYAHLSAIEEAKLGNHVDPGEKIGMAGDTGCSGCGIHLHFELRHGDNGAATSSGWSYAIPELYPDGGNGVCGELGTKRLVQRDFTVERTNPKVTEELQFAVDIANDGELPISIDTVFLRLTRDGSEYSVNGWKPESGVFQLEVGTNHVFSLREPPLTIQGLWRIHKVEVKDVEGTWYELGSINGHVMVGYSNLVKDHSVTVSSVRADSGNAGARAVDGDFASRWESEWSDNQELTIDLGSNQYIDSMILRFESAYPESYRIKTKRSGDLLWSTAVDYVVGVPENSTYVPLAPRIAWYIRIVFPKRATEWGISVREVEVYNQTAMGMPLDTTVPVGSFVNPPHSVGMNLTVSASIVDESGVTGAQLYVNDQPTPMSFDGSVWSASVPVSQHGLGTILRYLVHATDGMGNTGQVTGQETAVIEDRDPPTGHLVNVNPNPYLTMSMQAEFDPDLSGVAWVQAKVVVANGGWETINMANTHDNHWEIAKNVSFAPHGTTAQYFIMAGDHAGNSQQVTGIQPVVITCPGVPATTWCGQYFTNTSVAGTPAMYQGENVTFIDRNYGAYEPEGGRGGLGVDNFSIRWSKRVTFAEGDYTFRTYSDDGVRMYLDYVRIIDAWGAGGNQNYSITKHISAGEHIVVFEYVEYSGLAYAKLTW